MILTENQINSLSHFFHAKAMARLEVGNPGMLWEEGAQLRSQWKSAHLLLRFNRYLQCWGSEVDRSLSLRSA